MVVADHPTNVDALAAAVRGAARPLAVLVDIDPGIRRTGVATPEAAFELAAHIRRSLSLAYAGVQFYCGVQQHIASFADRRAAIEERTLYLKSVIDVLTEAGAAPGIVTGSVLVFLMALSSFVVPEFLGSGRVLTLATLIRQLISKVVNYPFAAALSVLLVLVIFMMLGVLSFGARLVRRKS